MERSSNKFLVFLKLQKILGNFASPNRYFTENSRWVPLIFVGDFFTLFMSYCQKVTKSVTIVILTHIYKKKFY